MDSRGEQRMYYFNDFSVCSQSSTCNTLQTFKSDNNSGTIVMSLVN